MKLELIFRRSFVLLFSVCCILPLVITLFSSFMSKAELFTSFHIIPQEFNLRQYETVLLRTPEYMQWFWNSVGITAAITAINLPLSLLAGYGFAKFEFPFKNVLFFVYIVVMLMPFQATLVPQYLTVQTLGLMNSQWAVILPNAVSAFGAFLMTQYIRGIDNEMIGAGRVDGLNDIGVFSQIIVPLCRPALAALFMLVFIDAWSVIEQPMIFIDDMEKLPLSIQLGNASIANSDILYAGGVVFMLLTLCIYLFGYKDLVEGISLGGVK